MSFDLILTLSVVAVMLLALVRELYSPDVVLFSALGVLLLFGVITPQEAFAGFSNHGMLTVAILFVVAYAAQSSGILEYFAVKIMGNSRGGRRSLVRIMAPVIGLSAFLNNTPIVAMFTPTIRDWARRKGFSPSKFLIPLSYASIFGGVCTLIGTSTNLVVNGMLIQATGQSLGLFELAWVGIPAAFCATVFMMFVGFRILPARTDMSDSFSHGHREYLVEMCVSEESSLHGKSVEKAGLRNLEQLYLAEIIRDGKLIAPVRPEEILHKGDILCFSGMADSILRLQNIEGLTVVHEHLFVSSLRQKGQGKVIEAVVSRSSPMLGKTIKAGNFRARYDAAVLAVHRHGERVDQGIGLIQLKPGDTLLLLAGDDFFKRWNHSRDFYMISKMFDLPVVNKKRSFIALATLAGMVLLSATGIMDILAAAVLAVIVLLISNTVTVVEARRSIELNVLIVIAASLGISQALFKSGAAEMLARLIVDNVAPFGPIGLLAAIYFTTSLLTEVITNNAAAALVFPVALASASSAGYDIMPFAIAVAVAASASFATPIGYQTNLIVYGPGGYRFTDFLKVGVPLNVVYMLVALTIIPLVWGF